MASSEIMAATLTLRGSAFPDQPRFHLLEKGNKLKGGKGDKLTPSDVDPKQLKMGIAHELEHTKDRSVAQEIALDHLAEDPKYYSKLQKIEKAAGLDLIQGAPQAQFTGFVRYPGQVPGANAPPMHIRPRLDPEAEKLTQDKPPAWTAGRALDMPVQNSWDVVKGLGLSKGLENRLRGIVSREILSAPNRLQMRKSLMSVLLHEVLPPEVRGIINTRATKLYEKLIQKSGYRETWSADDMQELEWLQKADARGGKYVARITKQGKHRYYYDESEYKKDHGEHSKGDENRSKYISSSALKAVEKAGGSCGFDAFGDLVKRYGPKEVHSAVRGHVDSGKLKFNKGKFSCQ